MFRFQTPLSTHQQQFQSDDGLQLALPKPPIRSLFTHWGKNFEEPQSPSPEKPISSPEPSADDATPQKQPQGGRSADEPPKLVPKLRLTLPKDFKPVDSNESSSESEEDIDGAADDAAVTTPGAAEDQQAAPSAKMDDGDLPAIPEDVEPTNDEKDEPSGSAEEPKVEETALALPEPAPVPPAPLVPLPPSDGIELADEYTQVHDLGLIQPLDKIDLVQLMRACLAKTVPFCLYCYHARRIAVNCKGLALHMLASHRFQAIGDSITAEELKPETFIAKFKTSLDELNTIYLNLDTYCSVGNEIQPVVYQREVFYECMQCRFTTGTHKELYVHNRKLHLRSKLICIMCKIPFYSFCDLICHMCPGQSNKFTILDYEFRCCLCNLDHIPSAFRLMIHLRRRHFACDVCVEVCHDVVRLSSHVWKHKLHHLCYRCGIAYRNKADIQKHLFWRHGTESVQCKRCLQKKWPHVYHFCMPPAVFYCETCGQSFTRAVSMRVHKRLHNDEVPYACTEEGCEKKFISKKLLLKHVERHNEPPPEPPAPEPEALPEPEAKSEAPAEGAEPEKRKSRKRRKKDDITDLINFSGPNLSESDSSDDSDTERHQLSPGSSNKTRLSALDEETKTASEYAQHIETQKPDEESNQASADIWERFRSFQEAQGKPLELSDEASANEKPATTESELESKMETSDLTAGTSAIAAESSLSRKDGDDQKPASKTPEKMEVDGAETSKEAAVIPRVTYIPEEKKIQILSDIVLEKPKILLPIAKEKTDEDLYRTFKPKLYTCQSDHDYCVMTVPDTMVVTMDDFESEIQVSETSSPASVERQKLTIFHFSGKRHSRSRPITARGARATGGVPKGAAGKVLQSRLPSPESQKAADASEANALQLLVFVQFEQQLGLESFVRLQLLLQQL